MMDTTTPQPSNISGGAQTADGFRSAATSSAQKSTLFRRIKGWAKAARSVLPSRAAEAHPWTDGPGEVLALRIGQAFLVTIRTNSVEMHHLPTSDAGRPEEMRIEGRAVRRVWIARETYERDGQTHLLGFSLNADSNFSEGLDKLAGDKPRDGASLAFFPGDGLAQARRLLATMQADTLAMAGAPGASGRELAWSANGAEGRAESSSAWRGLFWPLLGGLVLGLIAFNLFSGGGSDRQSTATSGASAQVSQTETPPPPPGFEQLTPDQQKQMMDEAFAAARQAVGQPAAGPAIKAYSPAQVQRVKSAHFIEDPSALPLAKGVRRVYAFEDPQCASCRRLSVSAAGLDPKTHQIVVIPVGFLEGSRDLAAKAFCSKTAFASWKTTMLGSPSSESVCEEGLRKVDANNRLFTELGLDSTPSIVATNGRLVIGDANTDGLRNWIDAQFGAVAPGK